MRLKRLLILINLLFSPFVFLFAQTYDIYYPWKNRVGDLEKVMPDQILPLLLNGKNYRIVKIEGLKGSKVKNISASNSNVLVNLYELPLLRTTKEAEVLDLAVPLGKKSYFMDDNIRRFFLLEFHGKSAGTSTISISITTNKKTYKIPLKVEVGPLTAVRLPLNVWGYYDYSFLTKGLKSQVIEDQLKHNASVMVVPPGALPVIGNLSQNEMNKFVQYMSGSIDKFQYYLLFIGLKNTNKMETTKWQDNFLDWLVRVNSYFRIWGIDESRVFLYPIDEPKGDDVKQVEIFKAFLTKNSIKNPLYTTIGGVPSSLSLLNVVDVAQVYIGNQTMADSLKAKGKTKADVWMYDVMSTGRNVEANRYRLLGFKAFQYDAKGIGLWNYSDADRSLDVDVLNNVKEKLTSSWKVKYSKPEYDYSLVYREKNQLYPSVRWKALSYGAEEYLFLQKYAEKYGSEKAKHLVNNIINSRVSQADWENIKIQLLHL